MEEIFNKKKNSSLIIHSKPGASECFIDRAKRQCLNDQNAIINQSINKILIYKYQDYRFKLNL
jgi:hypothetical protein